MRVLWFINTPLPVERKENASIIQGGWISTLEKNLSADVDINLAIAYPANHREMSSFSDGKTTYYGFPAFSDGGIIKGWPGRWGHVIEPETDVKYFLSIIENFKPDLIHIFGSERQYGLISFYTKIPVLLQIQGNLTECHQKWFSGLTYFDVLKYCNKKKLILGYGIYHQYYLIKKRAAREQKILAKCKAIVGRTDWDRRIMRIMAPDSRYYHCDELIRDEFFNAKWQQPDGQKIILVSTVSPIIYKGLETILKTASLLKEKEKIAFEWRIAGIKGTEELINIIEKAWGIRYMENSVRFLGLLNAGELADTLATANLYVHPSHIENSPNSVCEAMITGTPVIATYAGGTPSIVRNGEEGILVQDGDPYALTGAILELSGSPETMLLYSQNAQKKALSRHNPKTVVQQIMSIYRDVIEN